MNPTLEVRDGVPVTCETCLSLATHEACSGKDGDCLHAPGDKLMSDPFRYRFWVPSTPMEQMERLHALQVKGDRCILLGSGEAEVYATQTPQEASKQLHYVAEQCGYLVGRLVPGANEWDYTLDVYKDWGPFRIEWQAGQLVRVWKLSDDGNRTLSVFWDRAKAW